MDKWLKLRLQIHNDEVSLRELSRQTGLHRNTLRKIRDHSEPPGYRRSKPITQPKIAPWLDRIKAILESDKGVPAKQRHTAKRIWERLQDEGFTGGYTIVKDAVRELKQSGQEVYMPLSQHPGEAQVDFGQALVSFNGILQKVIFFVMSLVHSDAMFVMAFPRECSESFLEAHLRAFAFFNCVPKRISYDNTRVAVSAILEGHQREHTAEFKRLLSHYLFEPHFCNVRRPNEKGIVEGAVKYARQNFMVPVPHVKDYDELNRYLRACCQSDLHRVLRRKQGKRKEQLLIEDRHAALALPEEAFDYRKTDSTFATSESLVRYDRNDYSVPICFAHQQITIKASIRSIELYRDDKRVAIHSRCWEKEQQVFDPTHYVALLDRKPGTLDHGRPFEQWRLPPCFETYRKYLESHHEKGAKEYIRVLMLLNQNNLSQVKRAIEKALCQRVYGYDAVKHFLFNDESYVVPTFTLNGREHLRGVLVTQTDISDYQVLLPGGADGFSA